MATVVKKSPRKRARMGLVVTNKSGGICDSLKWYLENFGSMALFTTGML